MPKYTAKITRTVEEIQTIEFEASDEDHADNILADVTGKLDDGLTHELIDEANWETDNTEYDAGDLEEA